MTMGSIKELLYKTIHRNAKSAAQLADEIGISYSYLCRAGLPADESGVKFPLENLVPLMKAARDYSVLKHLNMLCGFLIVKAPRGFRDKLEEADAVNHYTSLYTAAMKSIMDFFRNSSPAKMESATSALRDVMEYSATLSRRIENYKQTEIDFEER